MDRKRLLTILIFYVFISCSDEELSQVSIGANFITPQTAFTVIDTFTVRLSTFMLDSIKTSDTGVLQVGKYDDQWFGKVSSASFFQIGLSDSMSVVDDMVFDSLTLRLKYTGNYYGDTVPPQTLNVYRVTEEIELNDDEYLYNTSSFNYENQPLGHKVIRAKPGFYKKVDIRLSDDFGEELLGKMLDSDEEVETTSKFLEYFKGLAVFPGDDNTSVIEFKAADSLLYMTLHAHYIKEDKVEVNYKFPLYQTTTCFNQVSADRTGTMLEGLNSTNGCIPSSQTGNCSFLEAGTGIVTRIDIKSLSTLLEYDIHNLLYKAELVLRPKSQSYKDVPLPEKISFYTTDKYNRFVDEMVDTDGNTITADFVFDEFYDDNTCYTIDITDYIMDELSDSYFDPDNGLIITMPDDNIQGSLDRLVLDASNSNSSGPVAKLYFVFYE